jgi:triacylglycerol lipase
MAEEARSAVAGRPSRWWGRPHLEVRWQAEAMRLVLDPVFRGAGVAPGDGRPVLLLPGFAVGDYSLAPLAGWLRRIGYGATTCGIWLNADCAERALLRAERRAEALHARHGRRVAVIGHSRGGYLAKALGARRPDLVSHVIALGSGRFTEACACYFTEAYERPFPATVRLTSIYSKGDGMVRWQSCLVPYASNVEVTGSHVGLAFNRKSYRAMALALAEPEILLTT